MKSDDKQICRTNYFEEKGFILIGLQASDIQEFFLQQFQSKVSSAEAMLAGLGLKATEIVPAAE